MLVMEHAAVWTDIARHNRLDGRDRWAILITSLLASQLQVQNREYTCSVGRCHVTLRGEYHRGDEGHLHSSYSVVFSG
jgi:hypothetical protein